MFCYKCGAVMPDYAQFCMNCGTTRFAVQAPVAQEYSVLNTDAAPGADAVTQEYCAPEITETFPETTETSENSFEHERDSVINEDIVPEDEYAPEPEPEPELHSAIEDDGVPEDDYPEPIAAAATDVMEGGSDYEEDNFPAKDSAPGYDSAPEISTAYEVRNAAQSSETDYSKAITVNLIRAGNDLAAVDDAFGLPYPGNLIVTDDGVSYKGLKTDIDDHSYTFDQIKRTKFKTTRAQSGRVPGYHVYLKTGELYVYSTLPKSFFKAINKTIKTGKRNSRKKNRRR